MKVYRVPRGGGRWEWVCRVVGETVLLADVYSIVCAGDGWGRG